MATVSNLPARQDIAIGRGTKAPYALPILQSGTQTPYDLTGAALVLKVKWRRGDDDSTAFLSMTSPSGGITVDDAVAGLTTLRFTPAMTLDKAKFPTCVARPYAIKDLTSEEVVAWGNLKVKDTGVSAT